MLQKLLVASVLASVLVACSSTSPTLFATTAAPPVATAMQPTVEPTATKEPTLLRVGIQPFASNLPLYIAQQEGYFAEQGIQVEFVPILSLSELTTAFILGEVQVTGSVLTSAQFVAISETPGFRFVADKGYLAADSCTYAGWVVRNDVLESGQLDDLSNLTELTIASTLSSLQSFWGIDVIFEPLGLTSKDLEVVEIPQDNRIEALRSGAVEMAGLVEPLITRALEAGAGQVWKGYEQIQPDVQQATLWYGPLLTQENRELGNRFMVSYLKAVRQYNEGKTDRNVELMSEFTQLNPAEVRSMCWQAIRSDGQLNWQSIIEFQEWLVANKYLEAVVPVEEFWDGSFVEYALNVLGN